MDKREFFNEPITVFFSKEDKCFVAKIKHFSGLGYTKEKALLELSTALVGVMEQYMWDAKFYKDREQTLTDRCAELEKVNGELKEILITKNETHSKVSDLAAKQFQKIAELKEQLSQEIMKNTGVI